MSAFILKYSKKESKSKRSLFRLFFENHDQGRLIPIIAHQNQKQNSYF